MRATTGGRGLVELAESTLLESGVGPSVLPAGGTELPGGLQTTGLVGTHIASLMDGERGFTATTRLPRGGALGGGSGSISAIRGTTGFGPVADKGGRLNADAGGIGGSVSPVFHRVCISLKSSAYSYSSADTKPRVNSCPHRPRLFPSLSSIFEHDWSRVIRPLTSPCAMQH